jgi:hypothetical protein
MITEVLTHKKIIVLRLTRFKPIHKKVLRRFLPLLCNLGNTIPFHLLTLSTFLKHYHNCYHYCSIQSLTEILGCKLLESAWLGNQRVLKSKLPFRL